MWNLGAGSIGIPLLGTDRFDQVFEPIALEQYYISKRYNITEKTSLCLSPNPTPILRFFNVSHTLQRRLKQRLGCRI